MMKHFDTMPGMNPSLEEASRWVTDNAPDGVICPCCQQVAKIYKRKLNRAMAYSLIAIYRLRDEAGEDGWLNIPQLLSSHGLVAVLRSREYQKLCYWHLLETKDEKRGDGGKAGMYRLTEKSIEFVHNRLALPRHVLLYNGAVIDTDATERITIREALGDKFDYDELMGTRGSTQKVA